MQVTQADSSSSKRVGVAEHLIKFRSSPNLKNMKKFIRSKMDHIEVSNHTSPDLSPPPNSQNDPVGSEVQPPLPLDPPPLDKTFHLKVKQEVDMAKYENNCNEEGDDVQNKKILTNGVNSSHEESPEKPKVPICRDYIRGSCKRPGTCRYAHKYDLTQLVGVYTFCRRYQTSVCTFPNCKYVHATVFEEHHFYRTGILPPHALAHHKKGNAMQQLNLPPPTSPQEVQNGMSMDMTYANPPPVILNESGILPPHGVAQHNKVSVIDPPPPPPPLLQELPPLSMNHQISFKNPPPPLQNEISQVDSTQTKSSNRVLLEHQSNINQIGSSPSNRDTYEPFPKKCKHCDFMDFRLQYHKDETKKMARAKDQKTENTCILENRKKKINKLILALFRLPCNNQNHNDTEPSFGGDKDKSLEHLNGLLATNGRMAAIGDDE